MRTLLVAVQLLTRVPVRLGDAPSDGELTRAAAWFPLVGVGVGAAAAGAAWALARLGLPTLAPWAALATAIALTGAFHEDGLADCADGIFGGRDRARRLAIMRDSRLGTFGVVALVLVLGVQVAALGALPASLQWRALVVAHALGRAAALPLTLLPYARADEDGLGRPLARRVSPSTIALGLFFGAASLLLVPWRLALVASAVAAVVALVCARRFARDLGGVTGDALGAAVKLVEVATYVVAAAWAVRS